MLSKYSLIAVRQIIKKSRKSNFQKSLSSFKTRWTSEEPKIFFQMLRNLKYFARKYSFSAKIFHIANHFESETRTKTNVEQKR